VGRSHPLYPIELRRRSLATTLAARAAYSRDNRAGPVPTTTLPGASSRPVASWPPTHGFLATDPWLPGHRPVAAWPPTRGFLATDPSKLCHARDITVAVAQLVRAPGCGPGGRGFKSPRSPQPRPVGKASSVSRRVEPSGVPDPLRIRLHSTARASSSTAEQRTLNPQVPGSNPGGRTTDELPFYRPGHRQSPTGRRQNATRLSIEGPKVQRRPGVWELRFYAQYRLVMV